ncbi:MAG: hypothetical protein IKO30_09210 [Lachnospiraceae bacterium]|nr:hypothetical protein [Lachnospiraceae bacterium]
MLKKRSLCFVLGIAIILSCVFQYGNSVSASTNWITISTETVDDCEWLIQMQADSIESFIIRKTNLATGDYEDSSYFNGILITTDYVSKSFLGIFDYYSVESRSVEDYTDIIDAIENEEEMLNAQGYRNKVEMLVGYEAIGGCDATFSYETGYGPDAGFTKISCVYSYRVKNNNSNLINYKNAVNNANAAFTKSGVSGGIAIAAFIALGLATTVPFVGPVIGATVLGSLGLTGTTAYFIIDAKNYARQADIYFDAAKVEGTRI